MHNGSIRWKISKSLKVICDSFVLALTISKILTFEIFDHEKAGPGHGVQRSQWCRSMANIKICKRQFLYFLFIQDTTCTHESNTDTQRNGQCHGYRLNQTCAKKSEIKQVMTCTVWVFYTGYSQSLKLPEFSRYFRASLNFSKYILKKNVVKKALFSWPPPLLATSDAQGPTYIPIFFQLPWQVRIKPLVKAEENQNWRRIIQS